MNICLVSREYPTDDHTGGIGTYTEKTARALAQLGKSVSVITETAGSGSIRIEEGVRVVRLPAPTGGRLRTIQRAFAVARAVGQFPAPPDVVQVSEYRAEGLVLALRRPRGMRLVTRLATPTFVIRGLNRGAKNGGARAVAYYEPLERWQTRRSDGIIAITDALAEVVCRAWRLPRGRVVTIPNSVDFEERFGMTAPDLPAELTGVRYVLYFGRLEERKGVHILADALPRVLESDERLHAVFAGDSVLTYRGMTLRQYVEQRNARYRDRLHFFPRLPQRQLYPLIKHALIAVLPSLWEGLGNVALEALDSGTPVVATLDCGFGEVVEDGRSGLLVPPGDAVALAAALKALLADLGRLTRMRAAAKQRAGRFRPDRVVGDLLSFYESLGTPALSRVTGGASSAV